MLTVIPDVSSADALTVRLDGPGQSANGHSICCIGGRFLPTRPGFDGSLADVGFDLGFNRILVNAGLDLGFVRSLVELGLGGCLADLEIGKSFESSPPE